MRLSPAQVELYYAQLGIARPKQCNEQTLNQIVSAHVRTFPYTSVRIREDAQREHKQAAHFVNDLDDQAIFQRLVVERRGGSCFELADLLSMALEELGFVVIRSHSTSRIGNASFDQAPMTHKMLVVHMDKRWFLVDPGLGFFCINGAIEFYRDKACERETIDGWRYKIEPFDSVFRLSAWQDEQWRSFLDFDAKLESVSKLRECEDYAALVGPATDPLCNDLLLAGRVQGKAGRLGLFASLKPDNRWFAYTYIYGHGSTPTKQRLANPAAIKQSMQQMGLSVPKDLMALLTVNYTNYRDARHKRVRAAMLAVLAMIRLAKPAKLVDGLVSGDNDITNAPNP